MKKLLVTAALLFTGTLLFAQTAVRVKQDTVTVKDAELIIYNRTRTTPGVLVNKGNGQTEFKLLQLRSLGDTAIALIGQDTLNYSGGASGKSVQFKVGVGAGFPVAGDSTFTDTSFINRNVKVWRNGAFQYRDPSDGVLVDSTLGKITFRPALTSNERVYIEALSNVSLRFQQPTGPPPFTTNLSKLYAGAFDHGNNTFTLRWTTNQQTLTTSPRIVGLGSSTLAGSVLSPPNRMGDLIQSWLNTNTTSPTWINLAVGGYDSRNLMPTALGGTAGHNMDTALRANPDFIFISLPSNDVAVLSTAQILANFRMLDTMALNKGIPVFWETMQPRTGFPAGQQATLKSISDSIRAIWPTRYVEGFNNTVDVNASTPAVIRAEYAYGDATHLNPAGTQVVTNELLARWQAYFQPIQGVSGYIIEASADGNSWSQFDVINNAATVKKTYNKPTGGLQYFRVRAQYTNSTYSAYSNSATYYPVFTSTPPDPDPEPTTATRILVDLGGDGVTTIVAGQAGQPTTSPNGGNYWNNWYGSAGSAGFNDQSTINNLKGTDNSNTTVSLKIIGDPCGTYDTGPTNAFNSFGPTVGVSDYPASALIDNMMLHSSINPNGITLRVGGLTSSKQYTIKLWGGRYEAGSPTSRFLESRLSTETWSSAKTMNTLYTTNVPEYNRAITYTVTGKDSVDIMLRVGGSSTFAHVSVVDITISNPTTSIQSGIPNDMAFEMNAPWHLSDVEEMRIWQADRMLPAKTYTPLLPSAKFNSY